jgi:phosphohistidine phosphatase
MKTLILMRHAKAVREHEAATDKARGLTPRGMRDAAAAGAAIAKLGVAPDAAVISTARRTRETYAEVGPVVGMPESSFEEKLYLASAETIWREAGNTNADTVLVIGHNPGLHALAAELVEQSHDKSRLAQDVLSRFPTSAWAAFEVDGAILTAASPRLLGAWRPTDAVD